MRVSLPSIAVIVMGVVAIWPNLESVGRFELGEARLDPRAVALAPLMNARFQSVDDDGRPFTVAAVAASPSPAGPEIVELDRPRAAMRMLDGAVLTVLSSTGVYDREDRILELFGDVELAHEDGHSLTTDVARIDVAKGEAVGAFPVRGDGPRGALTGTGFRVSQNGDRVFVTGPATLVLTSQPAAEAE